MLATYLNGAGAIPRGEVQWRSWSSEGPGETSTVSAVWVVPPGVTSICAVAIGNGGYSSNRNTGGGGGALSYSNNISVTPGESLDIAFGSGNAGIRRAGVWILYAEGGKDGALGGAGGRASVGVGDVKYSGGAGGAGEVTADGNLGKGGGGGSAGYAGNGGQGGNWSNSIKPTSASGGGGGGGAGNTSTLFAGGGGGVGLTGTGTSGVAGVYPGGGGTGGSGGSDGGSNGFIPANSGGICGGGEGGYGDASVTNSAKGGVRIIWGIDRSYPNNAI